MVRKEIRPWDVRVQLNPYIYLLLSNRQADQEIDSHLLFFPSIFFVFFLAVHWWIGARAVVGLWPMRFGARK